MPGLWRTFSGLDPDISIGGNTYLPAPSRIIFPRLASGQWRDHRKINSRMIRASFPSTSIETKQGWQERLSLDQAYNFDIVVLAQSAAASQSPTYNETHRAFSNTLGLFAPRYWWAPVRNGVLEAAGLPRGQTGVIETDHKIIITYIVTQGRGLTLEYESHQKLSDELRDLERDYDWEVNIVVPENMSMDEQLSLAARSTVSPCPFFGTKRRLFAHDVFLLDLDYHRYPWTLIHKPPVDDPEQIFDYHRTLFTGILQRQVPNPRESPRN